MEKKKVFWLWKIDPIYFIGVFFFIAMSSVMIEGLAQEVGWIEAISIYLVVLSLILFLLFWGFKFGNYQMKNTSGGLMP